MKSAFLVAAICISLCSCKNSSTKQATIQQLSEHQYQKIIYMQDTTGNLTYEFNGSPVRSIFVF